MTCPSCQASACDCNLVAFPSPAVPDAIAAPGASVVDIGAFKRNRDQKHRHRIIIFAVAAVLAIALIEAA
jgi:hypothetical protein